MRFATPSITEKAPSLRESEVGVAFDSHSEAELQRVEAWPLWRDAPITERHVAADASRCKDRHK